MPAGDGSGDTVTLNTTSSTDFIPVGGLLYVEFWGWMRVEDVPSASTVELSNPADTATDAYSTNAAAGTTLPAGAVLTVSGPQGPAGSLDGSLYLLKASNLSDVASPAMARSNLGLGTAATYTAGVANGQIPFVNDAGGLTVGEVVYGTGVGLASGTAPVVRGLLGLGQAALFDEGTGNGELPKADGALTAGDPVVATADGLATQDAATFRATIGVTSGGTAMLLFKQVTNTNGGAFNAGARRTVPLNTELVDTGNNGSIAANQVTLAAGTYRYRFGVVGNEVDYFVGSIYNVTAGALIVDSYGSSAFSDQGGTAGAAISFGSGRFTIAVQSVIELSGDCQTSQASNGFGVAGGFTPSGNYTFSWLELEKE